MKTKYENILSRIKSTRRRETSFIAINGFINLIFVLAIVLLFFTFIELLAQGDTSFRGLVASGISVFAMAGFIYFMRVPIGRALGAKLAPSVDEIALRIGKKYPEVGDNLCNGIQLYRNKKKNTIFSEELTEAALNNVDKKVQNVDFNRIVSRKPIFYSTIRASIALTVLLLTFLFSNAMWASFERLINYDKSYIPPAPFSLIIADADSTILRGEKVVLKIKAEGDAPHQVRLKIRVENQTNFDTYELELDTNNTYTYEIKSIKRTIEYYAEADWLSQVVESKKQTLRVIYLPIVRSLTGSLRMPNYTGLASRSFDEKDANIIALRGSTVDLSIFANKDLKEARIIFISPKEQTEETEAVEEDTLNIAKFDTLKIRMRVSDRKARGRFFIMRTGTYHIHIVDNDEQVNLNPIAYNITCLDDLYPSIVQTEPIEDKSISHEGLLPIYANISDDYGFKYMRLYYRLVASKFADPQEQYSYIEIPINPSELNADVLYVWDLHDLNITPEDIFQYYLEVADNDVVGGPKTAKTKPLLVRLPSLSEIMEESDETLDNLNKELEEALKEAEELQEEMKKLNREVMKKDNKEKLDWSEKKKAQEILDRQKQLQDKMKQLSEQMQENSEKLNKNQMISAETLEKFMELQKLMEQIDSPELRAQQEKVKKALENMSPEDLKKAMKEHKFNEEQFKKGIERTMKLLKLLQAEQKADALAKRAEKLAEDQDKLKDETSKTNKNDEQAKKDLQKKQDGLKDDFEKLADDFKDWEKLMEEIGKENFPEDLFEKTKQDLQKEQTEQAMDQAKQEMQKSDMQKAQQNQKSASQKMKQFSQSMKQMRQAMQQDNKKEAIDKMQKAMSDMQELSDKQEKLGDKTQKADYNSTKLPEYAKEQAEIFEQMTNVAYALGELSKKSMAVPPEMGASMEQAMKSMSESVESMANGSSSRSAKAQKQAMGKMNQAMSQMQQQLSAMKQSGSCSNPGEGEGQGEGQGQGMGMGMGMGSGQQLQQMAAQQQQINQALQKMQQGQGGQGGGPGGKKMSQQQMAEAQKLGGQMGKSGKSMGKMADEQKKFGNSERKAGEMKKLAQEMEKVGKEIASGNITPQTLKRQEQILNKMLDISKSINDRDFEQKREAQSGKTYKVLSPAELDMMTEEGRKRAYKELMDSNKQGYSKDYEELIRHYYEALQTMPTETK